MKDQGLNRGLVQDFDTSSTTNRGVFYSFRKMFWKFLKKLHVPFYDNCCITASGDDKQPVGFDVSQGQLVTYNGTAWVPITSFDTTTTTSTTTAPTTTTTSSTTAPTTTTTTTISPSTTTTTSL